MYFCTKVQSTRTTFMKYFLSLLILIGFSLPTTAQSLPLDSAKWYSNQAHNVISGNLEPELYIPYLKRAASIYAQHEKYGEESYCLMLIGDVHKINGRITLSEKYYYEALQKCPQKLTNDRVYLSLIYRAIRSAKIENREYDSALYYIDQMEGLSSSVAKLAANEFINYDFWEKMLPIHKLEVAIGRAEVYLHMRDNKQVKHILDSIKQINSYDELLLSYCEAAYSDYYVKIGDYNKALIAYYQKIRILKQVNPEAYHFFALIHKKIGDVYRLIGLHNQGIQSYEKSLEFENRLVFKNLHKLSKIYNSLGELSRETGEYSKALVYYKQAFSVVSKIRGEINFGTGSVSNNIGETYFALGDYKKALDWHKKSLKIRLQIGDHPYRTNSFDNLGLTYLKLENYDLAEKYISEAYKLRSKYPKTAQYLTYYIKSYLHMAELYQAQGKQQKALFMLNKAIESNIANIKVEGLARYDVYNKIGDLHATNANWKLAIEAYQKAIDLNVPEFKNNAKLSGYYQAKSFLHSLSAIGKANQQLYLVDHSNTKALDLSERYNQWGIQLIKKIRQSYTSQKDKLFIASLTKKLFQQAIASCDLLYAETQDERYLEQMFWISEQSKAGTLRDAQNKQIAQKQAVLPDSLLQKERRFAALKSYYQQKVNEVGVKDKTYWEQQLFSIKREQEVFNKKVDKYFPAYFELKSQDQMFDIKSIQAKLAKRELLIEFFEGEQVVYAFCLDNDNFRMAKIPKANMNMIRGFRNSILNSDIRQYIVNSRALYKDFVEPLVGSYTKKLTIIPDGPLWHLNFELLLSEEPSVIAFGSFPYLLRKYHIRYAYSGSYLLNSGKASLQGDLLAFAPSYKSLNDDTAKMRQLRHFRSEVGELMYNQHEVDMISQKVSGEVFTGKEALEKYFKEKKNQHAVLHLAMHALVDNDEPANSCLVFTHDQDSIEDNLLHMYELYNMNISADLAVLSACNTGYGKLESGEGFMSLGRAFSYAGCPAVVMSQWRVDDLATSKIMTMFYDKLDQGMEKSQALRYAKLAYLSECGPREAAPFYWGSFVMMGSDTPIKIQKTSKWWYVGFGFFLLLGGVFVGNKIFVKNERNKAA